MQWPCRVKYPTEGDQKLLCWRFIGGGEGSDKTKYLDCIEWQRFYSRGLVDNVMAHDTLIDDDTFDDNDFMAAASGSCLNRR